MVGRWGMSETIGPVSVLPVDGRGPLLPGVSEVSPHTHELVDGEVRRIVEESYADVLSVLRKNRGRLDSLAGGAARARDARRGRRLHGGGARAAAATRPPARGFSDRRARHRASVAPGGLSSTVRDAAVEESAAVSRGADHDHRASISSRRRRCLPRRRRDRPRDRREPATATPSRAEAARSFLGIHDPTIVVRPDARDIRGAPTSCADSAGIARRCDGERCE